jgi:hypothetical protein
MMFSTYTFAPYSDTVQNDLHQGSMQTLAKHSARWKQTMGYPQTCMQTMGYPQACSWLITSLSSLATMSAVCYLVVALGHPVGRGLLLDARMHDGQTGAALSGGSLYGRLLVQGTCRAAVTASS